MKDVTEIVYGENAESVRLRLSDLYVMQLTVISSKNVRNDSTEPTAERAAANTETAIKETGCNARRTAERPSDSGAKINSRSYTKNDQLLCIW